jgi:KUP system potassium uptake protein
MERHLTNDLNPMNQGVRNFIERYAAARVALKIFGVLGVSMVMVCCLDNLAKSVLTPHS